MSTQNFETNVPNTETPEAVLETEAITRNEFDKLGFEKEGTFVLLNEIPGISVPRIEGRLAFLKSHGFKYIDRIAEDFPRQLFGSREKDIEEAIDVLKTEAGLDDPVRALSKQPQLIFVNREKVQRRFSFLKELGFEDPSKMIKMNPGILGYTSESLVGKIGFLKDAGISEPLKVVEVASDLLSMDKEVLLERMDFLKKTFPSLDISELVMKFKKILTYPMDAIADRKKLVDRIFDLYGVNLKTEDLVLYFPAIFSYSSDRVIIIARIMNEYEINQVDVKKTIVKLISKNLDAVIVAFAESQKACEKNIDELFKRVNATIKSDLSDEAKEEIIDNDLSDEKIILKYNKLSDRSGR